MKAPSATGRACTVRAPGTQRAGKPAGAQPLLSDVGRRGVDGARGKAATAALRAPPARSGALGAAGP